MKSIKTGIGIIFTLISIGLLVIPAMATINSVTLNGPAGGFESRTGSGFNFSCNTSASDLINLTLFTNISGSWQGNASIRHGVFAIDVNEEIWDSQNYGTGWSSVNVDFNGGGGNVVCMAATPNNTIYAVDTGDDVWASNNLGVTWSDVNTDYNGAENHRAIAMTQYNGLLWIVEDTDEDVWMSANNGVTWNISTFDFDGADSPTAVSLKTNSSGALFAMTDAGTKGKVWLSMNNGTNWSVLTSNYSQPLRSDDPIALAITNNNTLIILDTSEEVWMSSNGANWTRVSSDFNPGDGHGGAALTTDGWNLFAADANEDIYVSTNFGMNWSLAASNINGAAGNIIAMAALWTVRGNAVNVQLNHTINNLPHGTYVWNCRAADNASNTAFAAANRTFYSNISAALGNATASPNPVKGGNNITITAAGPEDPDNQTLQFFCDEGSATPDATNTDCIGGRTNSSYPYNLSCTYAAANDNALHRANCRTFDGTYYSAVRTANFTTDSSPPTITSIGWTPNTADQLDPNVKITVTANVSDATAGVDKVLLRYKQANASLWSTATMANIGNIYSGNFTPDTADTWTFRIEANDTFNITNATDTNLSIQFDGSWNVTPLNFGGISGVINSNVSVGNLLINNTGDYTYVFTITSNYLNTFLNATTLEILAGGTKVVSVVATTSGTVREDDVTLTISTANSTAAQPNITSDFTLISFVSGPYLYITISAPAVLMQGDSANITITVKNVGNDAATDVWLAWSLPTGWSITSAESNVSIGNLGVGNDDGDTFTLKASSEAAIGTNTLTALAGSIETSKDKNVSIVVTALPTTTTEIITVGGGGGGMAAVSPDLFLDVPQSTEIMVGKNATIRVGVVSTYDSDITNLTIGTSGFLSQYVTTKPRLIDRLSFNRTGYFSITINAPTYMSEGKYPLTVTVKGYRSGSETVNKSGSIDLIIHTLSTEQLNVSLTDAEKAMSDMTGKGFDVSRLIDLLSKAKTAMAVKDFGTVQSLADQIIQTKEKAFAVDNAIKELEKKIADAEAAGRETTESKKALELAKDAFSRGDYDRAESRLSSASLTFAIESSKINVVNFVARWWWLLLISAAIGTFLAVSIWREIRLWRITKKLSSLQKEERAIIDLMEKTQKEYYQTRTMPKMEFYRTMYEYEKRLGKVRAMIAKLTSEKTKMVKVVEEMKRLELEDRKVKDLIIDLQKKYFEEGKISKEIYSRHLREYVGRRTEIAQNKEVAKARLRTEERVPSARIRKRLWTAYNRFMSGIERLSRRGRKI